MTEEAYTWRAVYDDGTCHNENADNSFADVDQSRVKAILLLSLTDHASHCIHIPTGAQAIFFRRRQITLNPIDESMTELPTTHCIGWKRGGQAVYLFAFDDGSTLLTENLQAV